MTLIGKQLVDAVLASQEWAQASQWGEPRPGHPEGTVGRHVEEQVRVFVDRWFKDEPDYWDLVALAYLHDIGKPQTQHANDRLVGDSHSVISARIAASLGASDRLVQVILSNDRAYSHWRKLLDKSGRWSSERWTSDRREKFRAEFGRPGLDLELLVLFHRADNGYRRPDKLDESVDPTLWFESRLLAEGLLVALPDAGRDQRLLWKKA